MKNERLKAQQVREILIYLPYGNPPPGTREDFFCWAQEGHSMDKGIIADNGELMLALLPDGERYPAAEIAYCIMTGHWPTRKVIHIDGQPLNNNWSNLRLADGDA